MALDFPNSPTNGQVYTDPATGEQWVYDAATNSWTSKGLVNTGGGLQYKGDIDITAVPPAGASSGWQYSVNPGGTANAGFGPGVTGNVTKGSMVMYTGSGWIETSHSVPDATALVKGIDYQRWSRTGTVLSPTNAGDDIDLGAGDMKATEVTVASVAGNGLIQIGADNTGKLVQLRAPFSWDANDDTYNRIPVADRSILVQARMKRCLVTDAGVVTYLDADDSAKLAGDWVRLVETTELDTAYTGTHQAEQANTELRSLAPAWSAGTFTKGALVTNGGFVWECVAATTTATPAAGTVAATLDGTAGQVMVEIPLFSVKHNTDRSGVHKRHEFAVVPGVATTGGFAVHPAFVKPDGSFRDFIYVGAYQGTGTSGNGSASGVNNAVNFTRATCRAACSGRGAGWHQLGYWENNALQWLLITEYQDMNSQRVLGNGAMAGAVYAVPTGLSNARGNRCGNAHTPAGANTDYVSYRGVENFYGRAWQWIDGINVNERNVYLCADPSKWADNTATNYVAAGSVPFGSGSYQRDVMNGIALLPSSVTGASATSYVGDALWINSGWRVANAGGPATHGGPVGALCVGLGNGSSDAYSALSGRLAYAV